VSRITVCPDRARAAPCGSGCDARRLSTGRSIRAGGVLCRGQGARAIRGSRLRPTSDIGDALVSRGGRGTVEAEFPLRCPGAITLPAHPELPVLRCQTRAYSRVSERTLAATSNWRPGRPRSPEGHQHPTGRPRLGRLGPPPRRLQGVSRRTIAERPTARYARAAIRRRTHEHRCADQPG
jgi:hypothetical protein